MKNAIFFILSLFLFTTACSSGEYAEEATAPKYAEMDEMSLSEAPRASGNEQQMKNMPEKAEQNAPQTADVERKLIKRGEVSFETEDLEATRKRVLAAIEQVNGYVSEDRENDYGQRINHYLTVRVPAENFDRLLEQVGEGVDHFDSKNISVSDVTEEFLDVQARLKTKKQLEARYRELLEQANTVSEILEIEREIGNLRSEIESVEGRLNYLKNQVSFSTLEISFYKTFPGKRTDFGDKFSNGFQNGWQNLIWFLVGLVNVWPFVLILAGLVFLFIRWRQKQKRKKAVQKEGK